MASSITLKTIKNFMTLSLKSPLQEHLQIGLPNQGNLNLLMISLLIFNIIINSHLINSLFTITSQQFRMVLKEIRIIITIILGTIIIMLFPMVRIMERIVDGRREGWKSREDREEMKTGRVEGRTIG